MFFVNITKFQLNISNLKAEMKIRSLNQKVDLLLREQIKILFETQEKQFLLLDEISDKMDVL